MIYCNKCGSEIEDVNKPCPTCGLLLNQVNYENNNTVSAKDNFINILIGFMLLIVIIFVGGFFGEDYLSGDEVYSNDYFSIEYNTAKWGLTSYTSSSYAIFSYVGNSDIYLQIPSEILNIGSLDNSEQREVAYNSLVASISSSTDINFTNLMSSIESLEETNYYYFSTNFASYTDEYTFGKLYIVSDSDGKSVLFYVFAEDEEVLEIENDIITVLKSLEIK